MAKIFSLTQLPLLSGAPSWGTQWRSVTGPTIQIHEHLAYPMRVVLDELFE